MWRKDRPCKPEPTPSPTFHHPGQPKGREGSKGLSGLSFQVGAGGHPAESADAMGRGISSKEQGDSSECDSKAWGHGKPREDKCRAGPDQACPTCL